MIESKIEQHIKPNIESLGYELWGCQYIAQGRHGLLRIYIDKADGIGIEDCERVSHCVSAILDVEDPISDQYRLEVSSPGIPRPLFYDWQYQRYIGELVEIRLLKPIKGQRKFSGNIVSLNGDTLQLKIDEAIQEFSFSMITKALLHLAV